MINGFMDILGSHIGQFASRMGNGFRNSTELAEKNTARDAAPVQSISPEQVLQIMQGNSELMAQFELNIEKTFADLGDRVLQRWMQNIDGEMRRSLQEVMGLMNDVTGDAMDVISDGGSLAEAFSKNSSRFGQVLGNLAGSIVQSALTRTRVTSAESQRSREASALFRNSRGQAQADLSRDLAQGKRYM